MYPESIFLLPLIQSRIDPRWSEYALELHSSEEEHILGHGKYKCGTGLEMSTNATLSVGTSEAEFEQGPDYTERSVNSENVCLRIRRRQTLEAMLVITGSSIFPLTRGQ